MGRILCIDYGERHTGVAVSDPTRTIAQALPTIHHSSKRELLEALRRLIAEQEVTEVVIGLPVAQSGKPSRRSEQVRSFAGQLRKATGLSVATFDERFSTARATEVLEEMSGGRDLAPGKRAATGRNRKRREAVDRIAATIILEDYLAEMGDRTKNPESRVQNPESRSTGAGA
ncbi:Holliday junction resolvase RuvX [candidate division WOR-3 bacterium]|uniref:Putative pre-16S rRNA nuclease n=1 Tax=candidate division WOR-3 bacterium TaxID=2052148 RepID=A0A937XDW5_UNCW3|nr:Holliday junction resolvase RuvX [candidate division WOR-3 bacterium]